MDVEIHRTEDEEAKAKSDTGQSQHPSVCASVYILKDVVSCRYRVVDEARLRRCGEGTAEEVYS